MKLPVKPVRVTSGRPSRAPNKSNAIGSPASAPLEIEAAAIAAARRTTPRRRDGQSRWWFEQIFNQSPMKRIEAIKRGVPAKHLDVLAKRMTISKRALIAALGLSYATVNRKARENRLLSRQDSELLIGIEYLIGQVQDMVRQSGDPTGFDAAKWLSIWLQSPLPAFAGETPASYLDTVEGQRLVSNVLAMMQSGTYA